MNATAELWAAVALLAQADAPLERIAPAIRAPMFWAVVSGALSLWLMLPRGAAPGRRLGILLGFVSLGCFGLLVQRSGSWADDSVFCLLAGITVVGAAATVTARSPVYSAIWFAIVLMGTAGLFLFQGAQFLGVATVVIYAGAILVTFLFVLMLAQPQGHAYYDRLSWEALLSAATGAVMIGILAMTIGGALRPGVQDAAGSAASLADVPGAERATEAEHAEKLKRNILAEEHVAQLGGQLFSRHLIAVEVAGSLLLAALVGAVAIVAQGKRTHPGSQSP